MKVSVVGQDTLASAVAECCSSHFTVTRLPDSDTDVLWLCEDTPIMPDGMPDVESIVSGACLAMAGVSPLTLVVLSSQVPLGTTARLEAAFPQHRIVCCPENIRVASAVADFRQQTRIVVGVRGEARPALLAELLAPFTSLIIWTTPETAELVKHTLNAYLGLTIAFINEIARITAPYQCDMNALARALRTEGRISPKAPLLAGPPFGGGHLERDIRVLTTLAVKQGVYVPLVANILASNRA